MGLDLADLAAGTSDDFQMKRVDTSKKTVNDRSTVWAVDRNRNSKNHINIQNDSSSSDRMVVAATTARASADVIAMAGLDKFHEGQQPRSPPEYDMYDGVCGYSGARQCFPMLSPLLLGSMGTGLIPELAVPIGRHGLATRGANPNTRALAADMRFLGRDAEPKNGPREICAKTATCNASDQRSET